MVKNGNGYKLPQKVGIIYSEVKREYFATDEHFLTEKDADKDASIVAKYLEKMGLKVCLYAGDADFSEKIKKDKPEVVINLVDSVKGYETLSSAIPGVLEVLNIPYTGADILGLSLDTNKFVTKKLLQQNGIPVPHYQLVNSWNEPIDTTLRYPLISKLNEIHGSVEIDNTAISETEKQLRERLKYLIKTYKQPVLVEEFIVGKEVTAILLEGLNKKVYLGEKIFADKNSKYIIAGFDSVWGHNAKNSFKYEKYEDNILREYVKKAFDTVRMYDYGKFDIRIDASGRYYFIDTNCNPAFGPKELDCALANILDIYGITFAEILKRLLLNTVRDWEGKERLPV